MSINNDYFNTPYSPEQELVGIREWVKNPSRHPEWPLFNNGMKEYINDQAKIEKLWHLTISGIEYQLSLNTAGKKHETNPFFFELANLLGREGLLSIIPNEPFALWSGGFNLSIYAQSKSFTTLEKTKAGKIFSNLSLYPNWKPLGPLWNHLSSEFTKNAWNTVHVFFRVHDPRSVLERQEIPQIQSSRLVKKIIFHPMVNKGNAVDALDLEELSLSSGENPRIVLKKFLVKICQKSLKKDGNALKDYRVNLIPINLMKLD